MTVFSPTLAASLPLHPGLGESILFQINGLVVVFAALCSIWGMLELTGIYFRRASARPKPAPLAVPATTPAKPVPEISPQMIAAIAAAVSVALNARHRIDAIVPIAAGQDWAQEGRRQIFASHQVR